MTEVLAPGYTVRRPVFADVAAVHAVIVASEIEEFGESQGYGGDDIEGDWKLLDLEHDAWVAVAPDGAFAGYGYVKDRQHVRLDVEIYVHPGRYGQGIGTTLVRLTESRAREHIALAPPGTRVVVNTWLNALNPQARSLLEREGYSPVRYYYRMEIDFSEGPSAASWPDGITLRRGKADEDLRAFYETTEEAMADHWGHVAIPFEEWRERRERSHFDPSLWFLVLDDGEPVAAVLCSISDGIGWIDTLAVRRSWRRHGLGFALLTHAFRELYGRGMRRFALGVDAESPTGATRLYEQAGMRIGQQYATYGKELRAGIKLAGVNEDG
ncbi:MAG: GNAT family N-acetyltransferase [Chloroflexi bacterium]|nr:GNAT family N-acetyltransferase [Chloroflexota bacterium]